MEIVSSANTSIVVLGGLLLFALLWIIRLELKWRVLFRGKQARTLEDAILQTQSGVKEVARAVAVLKERTASLDKRMKKNISGIGTVRFNPFRGTSGSNQSFATALLNEEGDGVVLSSIYSREHVSVFAKPIKNRVSEYELTEEEKRAIEEAGRN
ncbi:MAG: DUF4446 family protein [Parcubacteria group bacterium]|nr:DUF4446 family protein [Parcubacteria group bacterium]